MSKQLLTRDYHVTTCQHEPSCPGAEEPAATAARVVVSWAEQGWSLLCNGVILFADGGALLPSGIAIAPGHAVGRSHA
jgi:hypothetical protein